MPRRRRCPNGGPCFAERARSRAEDADIVVVNMHLYGLHVGSDGALLPEHDVVVFDEAHMLEDIVSATVGLDIGPSRATFLAAALTRVLADSKAAVALARLLAAAPRSVAPAARHPAATGARARRSRRRCSAPDGRSTPRSASCEP